MSEPKARPGADACTRCGLCNAVDPVLGVTRKETASTRYKLVLAQRGEASPLFNLAADTGLQEAVCPAGIDINAVLIAGRARSVKAGITTEANEAMRAAFAKGGFPYDSLAPDDFQNKHVW